VAEAWSARGHDAVFGVGSERSAWIEAAGFSTQPLPEITTAAFLSAKAFA
jgi:hypothetical protein